MAVFAATRWLAASPLIDQDGFFSTRRCPSAQRTHRYGAFPQTRFRPKAASSRQGNIGWTSGTRDYYEILGVSHDATTEEIRKAYRQLQKKHHPDISGSKGHAVTLLLNEAYQTLSDEHLRAKYNAAHPHLAAARVMPGRSFTGSMYSTWNGPDRPQGIFVDENACIGCRECVFAASNTFCFDESIGTARVKTQWGDPEENVKDAIQACPVNCIHWVERSDLPILEYLVRPQPKPSNGVFGGGWERPSNVFMAAKTLKHQMEEKQNDIKDSTLTEETPAQKRARIDADWKLQMGPLWKLFEWMSPSKGNTSKGGAARRGRTRPMFGTSCTCEVYSHPIPSADKEKTVRMLQEWAVTFASSSELPLPMPFRADFLDNGVQLNLISATDGVLSSVGSFHVKVEQQTDDEDEPEGDCCFLSITRHGVTNTRSLPGEGRIIKLVEDMLLKRDTSYTAYNIPWNRNHAKGF